MRRAVVLAGVVALLAVACFGPDPNLTEGGLSKPKVTISFPGSVDPGEMVDARIVIANDGPGDMESLVVAFARLGDPELPPPIVDVSIKGRGNAVVDVDPEPVGRSQDGILFTFAGIDEQESTTITFTLKMPEQTGRVANSILVYDGERTDRARGGRLETVVQ